jgi:hypothetical protein
LIGPFFVRSDGVKDRVVSESGLDVISVGVLHETINKFLLKIVKFFGGVLLVSLKHIARHVVVRVKVDDGKVALAELKEALEVNFKRFFELRYTKGGGRRDINHAFIRLTLHRKVERNFATRHPHHL